MEIEINTANANSGEPLIVVKIGDALTVLDLQTATDISHALTQAVAKSAAIEPVEPSLILTE